MGCQCDRTLSGSQPDPGPLRRFSRRHFGIEAAQPVLDQSQLDTPELYAETSRVAARQILNQTG